MRKSLSLFVSFLVMFGIVYGENFKQSNSQDGRTGPIALVLDETLDILSIFQNLDSITNSDGNVSATVTPAGVVSHIFNTPYTFTIFDFDGNMISQEAPPTSMNFLWNETDYNPITGMVYTISDRGECWSFDPTDIANTTTMIATVGMDAWSIGYDYDNDIIYWADGYEASASGAFDMETGVNLPFVMPQSMGTRYPRGLAYMENDPEGNTIYATWSDGQSNNALYKYNPLTEEWADPVSIEGPSNGSTFAGLSMTDSYREGYNDLVAFWRGNDAQSESDKIVIFEGYSTGSVNVNGLVSDRNDNPVENVEITDDESNVLSTTASDGTFGFYLSAGTYTLTFTHPDYIPVIVTDVVVSEEDPITIPTVLLSSPIASVNQETIAINFDLADNPGHYEIGTVTLANTGDAVLQFISSIGLNTTASFEGSPSSVELMVSPAEGNVQPDESLDLSVSVGCTDDQTAGAYLATLIIDGDYIDPVNVTVDINVTDSSVDDFDVIPSDYALHQNYPNPFNPTTEIRFDLAQSQNVNLRVFNTLGQEVADLIDNKMSAGYHSVNFDASQLSSGIYFYRIETEAFTSIKKMILVK